MMQSNWNKGGGVDPTEKRNVLLGLTGSIAAYKSVELARLIVSWGYEVRVVMSKAAQEFICPLTMASITGNKVVSDFWDGSEESGIGHIQLADWADVVVIAPASADCIAKLVAGFADEPLLAMVLATKAPVLVAPAMNVNMYDHAKTQENLEILKRRGVGLVDPDEGALACGWTGAGRLADPAEIFYHIRRILSVGDYSGKHVLITTGPTREYIDPVRFISNRSSGKMGIALAREAFRRGAHVTVVHGPMRARVPKPVRCVEITSATEMHDVIMKIAEGQPFDEGASSQPIPDVVIMAAAVADYRPDHAVDHKIKKSDGPPSFKLVKNPDILAELGKRKSSKSNATHKHPLLIGFAVETGEIEDLLNEARSKLESKNADLIVGNFAQDAFELDTNRVWLVDRSGRQEEIATSYKSRVANKILDAVLRL